MRFQTLKIDFFSKIYKLAIKNQMVISKEKYLPPLLLAQRKVYSTWHVITTLVEDWEEKLDQNFKVAAILKDLSKVLDCTLNDQLIRKLEAYGFAFDALDLDS